MLSTLSARARPHVYMTTRNDQNWREATRDEMPREMPFLRALSHDGTPSRPLQGRCRRFESVTPSMTRGRDPIDAYLVGEEDERQDAAASRQLVMDASNDETVQERSL